MAPPRTALDLRRTSPHDLAAQDVAAARRLDLDAVAVLGLPSLLLMENAARAVAEEARARLHAGIALVVCGSGNNGGDGLAAARFLWPRCRVALLGRPDGAKVPDAALQLRALQAAGVPVAEPASTAELDALANGADVLVDALLGTGLAAAPRDRAAQWIRWLDRRDEPTIAVDVPSGLSAETGEAFDPCVHADLTVTFARPKRGLLVGDGPAHAGRVIVATLGLPEPWVEGRDGAMARDRPS